MSHFIMYYRTIVIGLACSSICFSGDLTAIMQHKKSIKSWTKGKYIDFGNAVVIMKPYHFHSLDTAQLDLLSRYFRGKKKILWAKLFLEQCLQVLTWTEIQPNPDNSTYPENLSHTHTHECTRRGQCSPYSSLLYWDHCPVIIHQ